MSNRAMNIVQRQETPGSRYSGAELSKTTTSHGRRGEQAPVPVPDLGTASAEHPHPHPPQGERGWMEQFNARFESVLREIVQNREYTEKLFAEQRTYFDKQWESVLREMSQNREYTDKCFADMQKHSTILIATLVAVSGIVVAIIMNLS